VSREWCVGGMVKCGGCDVGEVLNVNCGCAQF